MRYLRMNHGLVEPRVVIRRVFVLARHATSELGRRQNRERGLQHDDTAHHRGKPQQGQVDEVPPAQLANVGDDLVVVHVLSSFMYPCCQYTLVNLNSIKEGAKWNEFYKLLSGRKLCGRDQITLI